MKPSSHFDSLTPQYVGLSHPRMPNGPFWRSSIPNALVLGLGQRMMLIRTSSLLTPNYLELVLNSPVINEIALRKTTGGAAPRINVSTVKSYPIPLPPIAEQRRIVAKVEQLMALVNELETQLATSRATAVNLLPALLMQLTKS